MAGEELSSIATVYLYPPSSAKPWDELSTARFLHILHAMLRLPPFLVGSLMSSLIAPMLLGRGF